MTNFERIAEFHRKFDPLNKGEKLEDLLLRRATWLAEECKEAVLAVDEVMDSENKEEFKKAKAHLLKELGDVLCTTYGFLYQLEVDGDAVFAEVINSNLSKTPNPGGKAIKGPEYKEAQMERFVQ